MLVKIVLVITVSLLTIASARGAQSTEASKEFKSSKMLKTLKEVTIKDGEELTDGEGKVNCHFNLMSGNRLQLMKNQSLSASTVGNSENSGSVRIYMGVNGETAILSCEDTDGTLEASQIYGMLLEHSIVLKEEIAKQ